MKKIVTSPFTPSNLIRTHTMLLGSGIASTSYIKEIVKTKPTHQTTIIGGGLNWLNAFPNFHDLGQSEKNLDMFSSRSNEYRSPMPKQVSGLRRDISETQFEALMSREGDNFDYVDSFGSRLYRSGSDVIVDCVNGTRVVGKQAIVMTGPGPERTFAGSGVRMLNRVSDRRGSMNEITTAVTSIGQANLFKDKTVFVYGGGATASWVIEAAAKAGAVKVIWCSPQGFATANPSGRNDRIMELTENTRLTAKMFSLKYNGDENTVPDDGGVEIIIEDSGSRSGYMTTEAGVVVCATGADLWGSLGLGSLLGRETLDSLQPVVGKNRGVLGCTDDMSIVVSGISLANYNPTIRELIQSQSFSVLDPVNHVLLGAQVAALTGGAAVDVTKM